MKPSPRQLTALRAYLASDDGIKGAALAIGERPERTRSVMSALYRRLGVRNAAQAVAILDSTMPGWRRVM